MQLEVAPWLGCESWQWWRVGGRGGGCKLRLPAVAEVAGANGQRWRVGVQGRCLRASDCTGFGRRFGRGGHAARLPGTLLAGSRLRKTWMGAVAAARAGSTWAFAAAVAAAAAVCLQFPLRWRRPIPVLLVHAI